MKDKNYLQKFLEETKDRPDFFGTLLLGFFLIMVCIIVFWFGDTTISSALIQSTATFCTVLTSIGFSVYIFRVGQRNAIRDELYKKRLEIYNELYYRCKQVQEDVFDKDVPTEKFKQSISEVRNYIAKNRFYLSVKVHSLIIGFLSKAHGIHVYHKRDAHVAMRVLLELPEEIDDDLFVYWDTFYDNYYLPIVHQMERELNIEPLSKDIENLYRDQFKELQKEMTPPQ